MRMGDPNMTCVCICPTPKELLVAAGYQKPNNGALFVGFSSVMRSVLMDNRDMARVFADEWTITAGLQQVKQWIARGNVCSAASGAPGSAVTASRFLTKKRCGDYSHF